MTGVGHGEQRYTEECTPEGHTGRSAAWCENSYVEKVGPPSFHSLLGYLHMTHASSSSRSIVLLLGAVSSVIALMIACGGSGASEFDPDRASLGAGSSGASGDFGTTSSGASGNNTSGSLGDGAACAAEEALAERVPAHIFFIFDKSGSMGRDPYGDPAEKWNPVTAAFKGFLASPASSGVSANMTMFPETGKNNCMVAGYSSPDVALTKLPNANAAAFTGALGTTSTLGDMNDGTPTLWAVRGVLPNAKKHAVANPGVRTIVVMVTDGEPYRCDTDVDADKNTIANVVKELEKYKATVPTYVIGVGDNIGNMDAIARAGGGDTKALRVSTTNPAQTQREFTDIINDIRLKSLSCELGIPAAPAGQTLDFDKINVSYTPTTGAKQGLNYDAACAGPGWKFDNPDAPTKISLCTSTCDTVKKDPTGKVGVEFGCERRGGVN